MKVLITGIEGFIGSNIAAHLSPSHDIVGFDDYSSGVTYCPQGIRVHRELADVSEPDVIVHCAARADIRHNWDSCAERDRLWTSNVDITREVLERFQNVPIVFMSTLAIYDERGEVRATSPYAASKIAAEQLIQAYLASKSISYHIFRLSCVVGPNYHHGHIADFVRQYRETGKITPVSDGKAMRSHVHVRDVCDVVNMTLAKHLRPGTYGLSSGVWSCRETVAAMGIEAEWPTNKEGWVGDIPQISGDYLLPRRRSVREGVIASLQSCGWKGVRNGVV